MQREKTIFWVLLSLLILALGIILGRMAARDDLRSMEMATMVIAALISAVNVLLVQRTLEVMRDTLRLQQRSEQSIRQGEAVAQAEQDLLHALREFAALVTRLPAAVKDELQAADLHSAALKLFGRQEVAEAIDLLNNSAEPSPLQFKREHLAGVASMLVVANGREHRVASFVITNLRRTVGS